MKILKTLEGVELVIVDLEVAIGDKKQNAPTLCRSEERFSRNAETVQ